MTLLTHILGTCIATVTGYCLLNALPGWSLPDRRSFSEQIGLSYVIGVWMTSIMIFLFGYVRIPASLPWLLAAQFLIVVGFILRMMLTKQRPVLKPDLSLKWVKRLRWWHWLLILLILSKIFYVASMNLTEIRRTDDAFTYSLSVAKHTYFEKDHTQFTMHRNYPKIPGLLMVWFAMIRGSWNEFAINLPYLNYFLVLLLLFYTNIRKRFSADIGLIGTYLLSTLPLLLSHAVMIGYADLPMALFLFLSGVYAWNFMCDGDKNDLILAALFTLCLPLVKTEGKVPYLFFSAFIVFAAVAYRQWRMRPRSIWLITAGITVLVSLSVAMIFIHYGQTEPEFLPPRVWYRIAPGFHWSEIKQPLLMHFGSYFNNWMIFGTVCPFLLLALTPFYMDRKEFLIVLFSWMLLASNTYLFLFGGAYRFLVNGTMINRSYLQIIPTILFTCIVLVGMWNKREFNSVSEPL